MPCCGEACGNCCNRLGCGCGGHNTSETMASIKYKRACTDIPFLLFFFAFFVYLISAVWTPAYSDGNPNYLIRGVDWRGRICGEDNGVTNKKYAYWPSPWDSLEFKVCTDSCKITSQIPTTTQLTNNEIYAKLPYDSDEQFGYCIPGNSSNENYIPISSPGTTTQQYMGDIETSMPIIGASIAISFIVAFGYIWLMKCCVGVLVWSTIFLILIGGIFVGYTFTERANDDNLTTDEQNTRKYIGYAAYAITGIFFLIIVFARNKIRISIQVIKSAGRSIGDMPLMVFFPLIPLTFQIGFFFAWLYGCLYIFSAGNKENIDVPSNLSGYKFIIEGSDKTVTGTYPRLTYQDTIQNQFAPHFFLLLWVVQICVYFTFTVIAGSVSDWYFTERDENGKKKRGNGEMELSKKPVTNSCCRTFRYHMGTIIFAAFLIALVQFARWVIRYLERTCNGGKKPNKLQKMLFRLVDCLLWCLECCLDKISRNALIWTAIYGDAFCPSVCGSFKLIWANLARVAVINFFATIVTALGKIMIPVATTGLCGLILMNVSPYKDELHSPLMPCVIIFLISIAIGFLFITVYDTAIDTVFLCFLVDEKHNKGKGMLADEGLKNIVDKYKDESEKLAGSVKGGRGGEEKEQVTPTQVSV